MADVIRLLPDSVANQIAAGEVIQRPASVIKELVENAIDAAATTIKVWVTDAGKTNIQVIDDGKGMSETDARLAFERHATSKIQQASDLFALRTMGFRGEALASIAAVAQVELRTRTAAQELGVCVFLEGSRITSQEVVACPVGSNFAVRNLFFNVPARRKFLKSNQTELSNIMTEFERIALANPDISFALYQDDIDRLNIRKASLRQRIVDLFGKKLNQQLLPIQVETTLVKLNGFIGTPESSRKKGAHQYFFVNGRYMRHPYFHRAVMNAYERLIPLGEQVSYFIYFEVDPSHIDVNIHPTKTEIKFEDEQAIWQIIIAAVKESLGKFNAIPTIDFDTENRPDIPVFENKGDSGKFPPKPQINSEYNPFQVDAPRLKPVSGDWAKLYEVANRRPQPVKDIEQPSSTASFIKMIKPMPDGLPEVEPNTDIEPDMEVSPTLYEAVENMSESKKEWEGASLSYFQYKAKYIITSVKSGLMVVDQHRAHIRILYDKYRKNILERAGVSQKILFPSLIQLPPSQVLIMNTILDDLNSVGFDIADMGGGSYAINGLPSGTDGLDPTTLVQNMVSATMEKGGDVRDEIADHIASTLARKAALVEGLILSSEEMERTIDSLFACETPNYTPDGKLIFSIIPHEKIENTFN